MSVRFNTVTRNTVVSLSRFTGVHRTTVKQVEPALRMSGR